MGKRDLEKRQLQEIAKRLKVSREALGLKPAELCRITGIKPNTYSQWEGAKGRPNLDEATRLCDTLGYTLDWIYLGDPAGLPLSVTSKIGPEIGRLSA
jgi:transcriptional regulator with XRE-family HTH domain